ncbi:MAG: YfiR family protein [Cyclobacteriaceae bacterium]|jgi:hypothetical protein|nr:YfiR family protein [Cyclobacteriaceae bacterium]
MKKVAFLILFFSLVVTSGYSQNEKLKAVVLYSFTRYVLWPESAATGDFEIKILGTSSLEEELKVMAQSKKVGNRNIRVTRVENAGDIGVCHILVIPLSQSERLEEVLGALDNRPVLVVTEEPGLGARGSDINFVDRDGRLAFELNQTSVSKRKLKVSTELTRLAILI